MGIRVHKEVLAQVVAEVIRMKFDSICHALQ